MLQDPNKIKEFDEKVKAIKPAETLASEKLKIREMGSGEIEDYLRNIWEKTYNKNTILFMANHNSIIRSCQKVYNELTGKPILVNICDAITKDVAIIEEEQKKL